MSRFSPFVLLLSSSLFLSACGSVQAGDPCDDTSDGLCDSDATALICQKGKLAEIPCKGVGGCLTDDEGDFICHIKAVAGDACPHIMEGQGMCDATNENQLLKCERGAWRTNTCNGCFVSAGSVMCYQQ